jgi:endoglucanase
VAIGLNLVADTSKGADLSACPALSYRYKGASHKFKVQDGQVVDYAYHELLATDATEWKTVVIPWELLEQPVWTKDPKDLNKKNIKKMAWEVVGYANFDEQPEIPYLYVDDLKCVNSSVGIRMARQAVSPLKLSVNGSTLNVTTAAAARIQVFDMQGNMVMNLLESTAGNHQVSLEGMNRGNYVVRVKTVKAAQTARITLK